MHPIKQTVNLMLVFVLCAVSGATYSAEYVPDTIEFPTSTPLVFASAPVIGLTTGGAMEFWVAADWQENPGYHPVILSNGGGAAPIYQVSISGERDALLVQMSQEFGNFEFDFSDGQTHHVALLDYDDNVVVLIDGQYRGAVAMSVEAGSPTSFYIGSTTNGASPFIGTVSALRLWDVPPEPEEIAEFALRDVVATTSPHPNINNLVGYSDFLNGDFVIAPSLVLKESELMSREETIQLLGAGEISAIDEEYSDD